MIKLITCCNSTSVSKDEPIRKAQTKDGDIFTSTSAASKAFIPVSTPAPTLILIPTFVLILGLLDIYINVDL